MNKNDLNTLTPIAPKAEFLNSEAVLPYGCKPEHILNAMSEYVNFLSMVNKLLLEKAMPRLEEMLMPANFSSVVGEFMSSTIPKFCSGLVKNAYHNGHPDLIPANKFKNNSVQHHHEGIEIKASRYSKGWQGHNPEDIWLMVFVFVSNRPIDLQNGNTRNPFVFLEVLGANLKKSDWLFAGRSETSRRTITASVTSEGYKKMSANWIYRDSSLSSRC